MEITTSIIISLAGVCVALIFGIMTQRRNARQDTQTEQATLTTVLVKLESIGITCTEIKGDMRNTKADVQENRERIIKVEASAKQAHKRLDALTGQTTRKDTDE